MASCQKHKNNSNAPRSSSLDPALQGIIWSEPNGMCLRLFLICFSASLTIRKHLTLRQHQSQEIQMLNLIFSPLPTAICQPPTFINKSLCLSNIHSSFDHVIFFLFLNMEVVVIFKILLTAFTLEELKGTWEII